jgi:DNA/RNA endonuclease YhcR with UshA esterase domain
LPEGLVLALARAMSKRPEDRFDSAGQFAKALRVHTIPVAGSGGASGSGLATFAQQSGMLAPLARREQASAATSKRTAILGGVAGAAVVAVFGVILWAMRGPAPGGASSVAQNNAAGNVPEGKAPERAVRPAEDTARTPAGPGAGAVGNVTPAAAVGAQSVLASSSTQVQPPAATPVVAPPPVAPPVPAAQPAAPSDKLPSVLDVTQTAALSKIAGGDDARYPKRMATVEGVVRSVTVSSTGKVCNVEFEGVDKTGFNAVFFPGMFETMEKHFGGTAGAALAGKRIRVKGRVDTYRDRPQIVIEGTDQVEIVK